MRAVHEFQGRGTHRLGVSKKKAGDLTQDGAWRYSRWATYQSPAVLKRGKTTLVAVTNYYKGSAEFPDPSKLYVVTEHPGYALEEKTVE